jgi:hypothetical protein
MVVISEEDTRNAVSYASCTLAHRELLAVATTGVYDMVCMATLGFGILVGELA